MYRIKRFLWLIGLILSSIVMFLVVMVYLILIWMNDFITKRGM